MNIYIKKHLSLLSSLILLGTVANAQSSGSVETDLGFGNAAGDTTATAAETVYIGPGTYTINGVWAIYSKNVVIDPSAVISGTGSIQLYNPSVAGGTASATLLDGNNSSNAVGVTVVNNNASGIVLTNIDFPSDLVSAGFTNSSSTASTYLSNTLNLAVDGANVDLNGSDLIFSSASAAIITNYSALRMVITDNSITGHMVKQTFSTQFTFPVGIAAGDYTPATVTPDAPNTVHVSVQDYSAATPTIESPANGMYRTWHIYEDASSSGNTATLTLTHNNTTDGSNYVESSSYITDYTTGAWSTNGAIDYVSAGVNTKSSETLLTTSTNAWYSKTSNQQYSLPVTYLYFNAEKDGKTSLLTWATATEINNKGFYVLRSADGSSWSELGFVNANSVGGNSNSELDYRFVDANPINGLNYYKLKQVDLDGNTSESVIKTVRFDLGGELSIYPNPAYDVINVKNATAGSVIKIYTVDGKELQSIVVQNNIESLNVNGIASGMYVIQVVNGSQILKNYKFVKK